MKAKHINLYICSVVRSYLCGLLYYEVEDDPNTCDQSLDMHGTTNIIDKGWKTYNDSFNSNDGSFPLYYESLFNIYLYIWQFFELILQIR